jgi:hypothetical protein
MSWQTSLNSALGDLRKEEQRLERELDLVRERLRHLSGLAELRANRRAPAKRRLSERGRNAISRAAKKRWAKYRAEKRRQG